MANVPVGVVVLELESEATVIVIVSSAPETSEVVAAESVVFEGTADEEDVPHASSRL
jgi:hypothetical protein